MILKRRIKTVILLIMKTCMFSAWFWFHWTGDRKDGGGVGLVGCRLWME